MVGKYPVITLCGSTRFKNEYMETQKRLTLEGNIVISVAIPCSVQKYGKSAYIKEFVNGAVDFWVGALPILKG